ncbi:MAG: hypothetical protein Q8920_10470 [Bacillota bacterium]|nr:hypothetical protein [Bacillota bacterium]
MDGKVRNQRIFLMLNREDSGFGIGQGPSGYLKIEVRDGKGKLSLLAQDLKNIDNMPYSLYLIESADKNISYANAGLLKLQKSKGELQWEFDPENVAGSGHTIEKFNVAAVLTGNGNAKDKRIICPLAAYKGSKVEWREMLEKAFHKSRGNSERLQNIIRTERKSDTIPETVKKAEKKPEIASEPNNSADVGKNKYSNIPDGMVGIAIRQTTKEEKEKSEEINTQFEVFAQIPEKIENIETRKENLNASDSAHIPEPDMYQKPADQINQPAEQTNRSNEGCIYRDNNACSFQQGTIGYVGYNPCIFCNIASVKNNSDKDGKALSNAETLRNNLDKYFETCDPFGSRRKDYKWWRVNNPVYLNNVLYQSDIRTPLLFNPKVMMAHFKYKYLIAGIYTDRFRRKEYLVCGIPGTYNVDEKPFGDICRWVQLEGNRPKHGAFGYWLVYIDCANGSFINPG